MPLPTRFNNEINTGVDVNERLLTRGNKSKTRFKTDINRKAVRNAKEEAKQQYISGNKNIIPKGYDYGELNVYEPEQKELFGRSFEQTKPGSYLNRLASGDEALYKEMEAPAWRQFQEAQGQLASRFSGMGMGSRRGSGFANAANQQSQDFAMGLASKRQELTRQAQQDLHSMSQELLGLRPRERFLSPKEQKPIKEKKSFIEKYGPLIQTGVEAASKFIPV